MADEKVRVGNPDTLDDWVVENYEAIVADELRAVSYEDIASHADEMDDLHLAAWARKRAAESGKKVTPAKATPVPKAKRAPAKAKRAPAKPKAPVKAPEVVPEAEPTE